MTLECYLNTYGLHHNNVNVKGVVLAAALADPAGLQFETPTAFNLTLDAIFATNSNDFIAANQSFLNLSFYNPVDPGLNNHLLTQQIITPQAPRNALLTAFLTPGNLNINLASVSVKTLIIWGSKDAVLTLDEANYLHNSIPGSQLVILPNTGHNLMIENPIAFNLLLFKFANSIF